jgi:hypothetical protein
MISRNRPPKIWVQISAKLSQFIVPEITYYVSSPSLDVLEKLFAIFAQLRAAV